MMNDVIDVQLSVELRNKIVLAHLTFQNKSEKNIYLNKQVMYFDAPVRNNYFKIENSNGIRTRYLGPMVNCTSNLDEYIQLGPDETISSTISLKEAYELKEGEKYQIQYYAFNPSYQEEQQLMKMESNKVEVSY